MVFLWHVPSALVPVLTIPIAVLIAFVPFRMMGLSANIMSLGGLAIAVGALVDASIVVGRADAQEAGVVAAGRPRRRLSPRRASTRSRKSAAPSFFALLVIAVSFLPVLTLEAQEGRLFRPLAYYKIAVR